MAASVVPLDGVLFAGGVLTGVLVAGGVLTEVLFTGGVLIGVFFTGGVLTGVLFTGLVLLPGILLAGGLALVLISVPASIAFCCNGKVVETTGHPFPGPFKFCRVIEAAVSLADLSALESPVGKDTETLGLFRAFPA